MSRVRVKICGITSVADAVGAADAGADAIGINFYPPSPRCVSIEQAKAIALAVHPFVKTVGLFVNHEPAEIKRVLETVPLDLLQFHGDETEVICRDAAKPYIKALRFRNADETASAASQFPSAQGIMIDSFVPGKRGGTGKVFDWHQLQVNTSALILAGGLTPENVANAINIVGPSAVDTSGGVERAPGIKDHQLIQRFVEAALSA